MSAGDEFAKKCARRPDDYRRLAMSRKVTPLKTMVATPAIAKKEPAAPGSDREARIITGPSKKTSTRRTAWNRLFSQRTGSAFLDANHAAGLGQLPAFADPSGRRAPCAAATLFSSLFSCHVSCSVFWRPSSSASLASSAFSVWWRPAHRTGRRADSFCGVASTYLAPHSGSPLHVTSIE